MARSPGRERMLQSCLAILFVGAILCPPVAAEPYFDGGVTYYRQKNYAKALQYFAQAYRSDPSNGNAVYYQAVCRQAMGDKKGAIPLYASTVANFPGTSAATMALQALSALDPQYSSQLQRRQSAQPQSAAPASQPNPGGVRTFEPGFKGTSSDLASLPNQSRVPFVREGALLCVDASVNGHAMKMFFDTGAEMVALGKNQLSEAGIPAPTGPPTGQAGGVGSSGGTNFWSMPVDIKVGDIQRRNFPVCVQDTMTMHPLLGQSFFRDFTYTIDYSTSGKDHGTILFIKNGSAMAQASGSNNSYAVPFVREGNELIVKVEVNGKVTPMYFDSGASGCTFSMQQIKDLNLTIPDDAQPELHSGIGGTSAGYGFPISRMRLGPIEKTNIMISATQASMMRYPLLGQTFFGDWQYTIDNTNNVIRFVRR